MANTKKKPEDIARGRSYTLSPDLVAYLDWKVSTQSKPWKKAKYSPIVSEAVWQMMQSDRGYQQFLAEKNKSTESIKSENKS